MLSEDFEKIKEFNEAYECKREKTRDKLKLIIDTFNDMLQSGDFTTDQCYTWLEIEHDRYDYEMHKKFGFFGLSDFAFLYPEKISIPKELEKEINEII